MFGGSFSVVKHCIIILVHSIHVMFLSVQTCSLILSYDSNNSNLVKKVSIIIPILHGGVAGKDCVACL